MTNPPPPRTFPNPWVAIPVVVATGVGWFVGSSVARVSCRPESCTGSEILWGVAGALLGFAGVLVVAVLAVRSLAEWTALSAAEKQRRRDDSEPPTC
jgi:cytochrome c-type biogenesis protein CcmH/NrfF